ncbi:helix-turn-helix domain-containing protein [Luteimonas aestuarii]|uniref:Helix-turn-helix domain-containing protein n=1 Tax=Luteimonas aestuarii TaxID=453837 RepID=A0A4R5TQ62_9GAMM|nr:helix-turn-helix domain-containing protein [Luteimonas aestuarii]TDK23434.1 helix-turn-helix domain-containing protein [Luteimonas aestuarii]
MPHEPYNLLSRYQIIEHALKNPSLSRGHCVVLSVILGHVDPDGDAWPGMKKICSKAGISKSTAVRAVDRLERLGYLSVERRHGSSNVYSITDVEDLPTGVRCDTSFTF